MHRVSGVVRSVVGRARSIVRRPGAPDPDTSDTSRNYEDEREATRLGGMSDEDRAWETASRERNAAAEARDASSPERD